MQHLTVTANFAAGHLQNKLPVADLLDAGLLDQVFSSYTILKQEEYKADLAHGARTFSAQWCDTFVDVLLSRAMQEYKQSGVNHPDAAMAALAVTPMWMHAATQTILICMGKLSTALDAFVCFKLRWCMPPDMHG